MAYEVDAFHPCLWYSRSIASVLSSNLLTYSDHLNGATIQCWLFRQPYVFHTARGEWTSDVNLLDVISTGLKLEKTNDACWYVSRALDERYLNDRLEWTLVESTKWILQYEVYENHWSIVSSTSGKYLSMHPTTHQLQLSAEACPAAQLTLTIVQPSSMVHAVLPVKIQNTMKPVTTWKQKLYRPLRHIAVMHVKHPWIMLVVYVSLIILILFVLWYNQRLKKFDSYRI